MFLGADEKRKTESRRKGRENQSSETSPASESILNKQEKETKSEKKLIQFWSVFV